MNQIKNLTGLLATDVDVPQFVDYPNFDAITHLYTIRNEIEKQYYFLTDYLQSNRLQIVLIFLIIKKTILLSVVVLCSNNLSSQNLISNPSFEEFQGNCTPFHFANIIYCHNI